MSAVKVEKYTNLFFIVQNRKLIQKNIAFIAVQKRENIYFYNLYRKNYTAPWDSHKNVKNNKPCFKIGWHS